MRAYAPFLSTLERLAARAHELSASFAKDSAAALNGQAGDELRRLVPLEARRRAGAFFTGQKLADRAMRVVARNGLLPGTIVDITCGGGDLLLAAARRLPVRRTVKETLMLWGQRLAGCDLHEEFVHATRIRLFLLAVDRCAQPSRLSCDSLASFFPRIRVGNYRDHLDLVSAADALLLNPPYTLCRAGNDRDWASGLVSSSACCIADCVQQMRRAATLTAILPDVLRTGPRYSRWRRQIESMSADLRATVVGQFDAVADVDVFILSAVRADKSSAGGCGRWGFARSLASKVEEYFDVCVGTVVPHRDPKKGPLRRYIHARGLPAFGELRRIPEKRRHAGRAFKPPFVVIRRTSRPGDKHRCIATIITGLRPVFVENHLIVALPKTGSKAACTQLVKTLKGDMSNAWLDRQARCRHLTVGSIARLPHVPK